MRSLCLVLFLAVSMPGCSIFKKEARQDRTYTKYVKKMKAQRERDRKRSSKIRQRAEMPTLRQQQPSPPEVHVETSENQ
jgi:hypothetical protein